MQNTGKERMLNAYRGIFSDRIAIAPEFWYYYPAKLLGVDMIEFQREVPFHTALKTTFARFGCVNCAGSVHLIFSFCEYIHQITFFIASYFNIFSRKILK